MQTGKSMIKQTNNKPTRTQQTIHENDLTNTQTNTQTSTQSINHTSKQAIDNRANKQISKFTHTETTKHT